VTADGVADDEGVYITGNHKALGEWKPDRIALQKQGANVWHFKNTFPESTSLEFKITRGTWTKEAMYERGIIPGNVTFEILRDTLVELDVVEWRDAVQDSMLEAAEHITGDMRYHRDIAFEDLRPRTIRVWLPPGYEEETKRYPVLYMHDGQNIFAPGFSFHNEEWRVDEIADSLIRSGEMKPIIIVGVDNSDDRSKEYSGTPKGETYLRFLTEKLKPMIDSTYRTLPDRENTKVMGSSMGGLISFLAIWHYNDIFSAAGCLSPAFVYNDTSSIKMVKSYTGKKKPMRIYMDNGGLDLEVVLQPGCDLMLKELRKLGYDEPELIWRLYPEAKHTEAAWARRLHEPLLFMFKQSES